MRKEIRQISSALNWRYIDKIEDIDLYLKNGVTAITPAEMFTKEYLQGLKSGADIIKLRLLTSKRPRLVCRIDNAGLYRSALRFYEPGSLTARLTLSVLQLLGLINWKPRVYSLDYNIFYPTSKVDIFSSCMKPNLRAKDIIGIYIGTDDVNRKLVIYANNDRYGKFVIKLGTNPSSSCAIKNEYTAMKEISKFGLNKYLCEVLFFDGMRRGKEVLGVKAVKGSVRNTPLKEKLTIRFLSELHSRKIITKPTQEWLEGHNFFEKNTDFTKTSVLNKIRILIQHINLGLSHGDFSTWNIILTADGLKIIDWEDYKVDIIFSDLFQYYYSVWMCSYKQNLYLANNLVHSFCAAKKLMKIDLQYDVFICYFYLWLNTRKINSIYLNYYNRVLSSEILGIEQL